MSTSDIGIQVIVSGPGGCIYPEVVVVRKALEDAGFIVHYVTNKANENFKEDAVMSNHDNRLRCGVKPIVHMLVFHQPWGG